MTLKQQQRPRPRVFAVRDFPPGCGPNAIANHHHEPENGVVEDGIPIMTACADPGHPKRKRPSAVRDFPFGCGPNRIAEDLEDGWDECDGVVLQCTGEEMVPIKREGSGSGRPEKRRAVALRDFPAGFDPDCEAEGPGYPDSLGVIDFEGEGEEEVDVEGEYSVSWPPRNPQPGFRSSTDVGDDGGADESESESLEVSGLGSGA